MVMLILELWPDTAILLSVGERAAHLHRAEVTGQRWVSPAGGSGVTEHFPEVPGGLSQDCQVSLTTFLLKVTWSVYTVSLLLAQPPQKRRHHWLQSLSNAPHSEGSPAPFFHVGAYTPPPLSLHTDFGSALGRPTC